MTKSRWRRWTVRTGLTLLAAVILATPVVILLNPYGPLVVRILLQSLFTTTHPPAMFADQLAGPGLPDPTETSHQLTARLQEKFPLGTTEDTLKKALLAQGFKPLPPPPSNCVPPIQQGRPSQLDQTAVVCPPQDPRKSLQYKWGGGVCVHTITVRWSADTHDTVMLLDGYYYVACL
jgi:hypothetical protein